MQGRPRDVLTPICWLGSSKADLQRFPVEAVREVGFALYAAQQGRKSPAAKPLTGDAAFKGAVALEIVEDYDGNTYRAVYTAKFGGFIYVLHAFQKKSKSGIATPAKDIAVIKRRLKEAAEHHRDATTALPPPLDR